MRRMRGMEEKEVRDLERRVAALEKFCFGDKSYDEELELWESPADERLSDKSLFMIPGNA